MRPVRTCAPAVGGTASAIRQKRKSGPTNCARERDRPPTRESAGPRASRPSLVAGPRLVARARHLGVGRRLALRLLADAGARARRNGLAALGRKLGVVRRAA